MKHLIIALVLIAHIGCADCEDSKEIQRMQSELVDLKADATELSEAIELVPWDEPENLLLLEDELMMNAIQQAMIEIEIERITKSSDCL